MLLINFASVRSRKMNAESYLSSLFRKMFSNQHRAIKDIKQLKKKIRLNQFFWFLVSCLSLSYAVISLWIGFFSISWKTSSLFWSCSASKTLIFSFSMLLLVYIQFSFAKLLWTPHMLLNQIVMWHCFHLWLSYSSARWTFLAFKILPQYHLLHKVMIHHHKKCETLKGSINEGAAGSNILYQWAFRNLNMAKKSASEDNNISFIPRGIKKISIDIR